MRLYGGYPGLFLLVTAVVVIPYNAIVLAVAHSGALTGKSGTAVSTLLLLDVINWVVIVPLISSLELQALVSVAESEHPSVGEVFRKALPVLPGVAAAVIITGICVVIGSFLIIPGIYLAVRLAVVAQTAAFEQTHWPNTLSRCWSMTRRNFWHVLGTLFAVLIVAFFIELVALSIVSSAGTPVRVVVSVIVSVITQSFLALTMATLYFDLRAREPLP